ncbi:MAG: beta-lactamase family protein, partial [Phycisphaerales bacterium]|nr:beta-lactamase family protein [Phycisphaerales bacterium]
MIRWTCSLLVTPLCLAQTVDERVDWIEAKLEAAMAEHHVPGLAIVVVRDGVPILQRGMGVADLDTGRAVTEDTLFAIGSHTKAMTSFLVAQQVDEGHM